MPYSSPSIELLFLCTVTVVWGMIFYQLFFAFLGFRFRRQAMAEKEFLDTQPDPEWPGVSIMVPAHNEELVIEKTVRTLLALDYPRDRMEIIVVNDGSTDGTVQEVLKLSAEDSRVRLFNVPDEEATQGKAHALNLGVRITKHDFIAIYDADNRPEAASLKYLVRNLIADDKLAAVFGKFRVMNRNRTLLTRFINLETLAFQFMMQGGRYLLSRIAILPGTNVLMRRKIWDECGGWDKDALTEDTELSIRLYEMGYEMKFVPYAVTWEEEPELWGTWLRQRTRWVRGNFYVLRKYFLPCFRFKKWSLTIEVLHLFTLYYFFLTAMLLSHFFFLACGLGLLVVRSPGPYLAVWLCGILLFVAEIVLAISFEDEATPANVGITALMYVSYCQAWPILVFRALYQDWILRGKVKWEKTRRFASTDAPVEPAPVEPAEQAVA